MKDMKTKKVVRMPLRRTPATGKSRSTPKLRARAATADASEDDYEGGEEPNMRFSHALIVVLILHLIAVGGVFAFNWMKARQGEKVGSSAVASASGGTDAAAPVVTAKSSAPTTGADDWTGRTHTVTAGDTLTRVASNYGVTISAIESANGIDNYSMIRVGQVLKIPVAGAEPEKIAKSTSGSESKVETKSASAPAKTSAPSSAQQAFLATQPEVKKAIIAAVPTDRVVAQAAAVSAEKTTSPTSGSASETVYEVVQGDNPYSIAKKFHVSYNHLIEVNGISDPTKIQIGQKLKIPAK